MELRLNSGRIVHLGELRQWEVYEWLWEGLPTKESNQRCLKRIIEENQSDYGEPLLIEPEEMPIPYIEGKRYPFGEPAAFPRIACIARFRSSPARDVQKDYSGLIVVWFQNDFAFPIDPKVHLLLQTINWDE